MARYRPLPILPLDILRPRTIPPLDILRPSPRDWYFIVEKTVPAPQLARPEGRHGTSPSPSSSSVWLSSLALGDTNVYEP